LSVWLEGDRHCEERSDEAIQLPFYPALWIASRSLSSARIRATHWLAMTISSRALAGLNSRQGHDSAISRARNRQLFSHLHDELQGRAAAAG
jgi:hypothetical protein